MLSSACSEALMGSRARGIKICIPLVPHSDSLYLIYLGLKLSASPYASMQHDHHYFGLSMLVVSLSPYANEIAGPCSVTRSMTRIRRPLRPATEVSWWMYHIV